MPLTDDAPVPRPNQLIDPYGRTVDYLRVSVTDRCDFRCVYCMAEEMTFLPKAELLTLEELEVLCRRFMAAGIRKIRLTGGEPLVRRNIMQLIRALGAEAKAGALDELTITTNGSQLVKMADDLFDAGVRRVNISLDTLDPDKFRQITRWGDLNKVLDGLRAAQSAGLDVKINAVALKGGNDAELGDMLAWCGDEGFDMTIIEVMPMGDIGTENRLDQYLPLSRVRADLSKRFTLTDIPFRTGGPARYVKVEETGRKLGFITPLTHNFCESCNRVRVTCTGQLFMCLGQDDNADLRRALRDGGEPALDEAIVEAIGRKPKGHDFIIDRRHSNPAVSRHMNVTGG
ncbi:MAG: GTP 3',8-cyclase MoaA [Alphaproteobacteria bacterium]|nr:GTP 3',8-cyclase MoaA [Alphaproteobacteria bacterium]